MFSNYRYVSKISMGSFLFQVISTLFLGLIIMQSFSFTLSASLTIIVFIIFVHLQIKIIQFDFKTVDIWKVFVKKSVPIEQLKKITYYPNINERTRPILCFYFSNSSKFKVIEYRTDVVNELFNLIKESDYDIQVEMAGR